MPNNGYSDITLYVGMDTKLLDEAMAKVQKTLKGFSSTLSKDLSPDRELRSALTSLNNAGKSYARTLNDINKLENKRDSAVNKVQESSLKTQLKLTSDLTKAQAAQAETQKRLGQLSQDMANQQIKAEEARQQKIEKSDNLKGIQGRINQYQKLLELYRTLPKDQTTDELTSAEANIKEILVDATNREEKERLIVADLERQKQLLQENYGSLTGAENSLVKMERSHQSLVDKLVQQQSKIEEIQTALAGNRFEQQDRTGTIIGQADEIRVQKVRELIAARYEYAQALMEAKAAEDKLKGQQVFEKLGGTLKRVVDILGKIKSDFKSLISRAKSLVSTFAKLTGISNLFKRLRGGIFGNDTDWKRTLRYIIQFGLGFRSLFFLVRRLRTAFVSALEDMGKSIPRVQEGLDRVSISMNTLKGGLAVAFAPLLKVVAGLMERLAAVAIRAANAIAQFFAVITGQNVWFRLSSGISSYTDAVKGSTAATKDNEKELKKQLADFDDIDVLVKDVGDDLEDINPGGSGGLDGSELGNWEEVARPMSKLAELIKEAWKSDDVAQAFEEVGRYIGEYIQDALARLLTDFWPAIREKAEKVALAIAGTINGFFQTDAAVYFAKNIAAALNTALGTLSAYWNTVNWGGMGAKLQESIQALIEDIEWNTLAEYLKGKIKGILDFATNLLGDGSWITNLASNVSEVIKTVLSNVNFQQLGSTINVFLVNLLRGITNTLKENEKGVSKAVNDFIVGLNVGEILHAFGELLFTIFKMGLSAAFKLLASSGILSGLIIAWLTLELAKFVLPQFIISMLSGVIGNAVATATGEAVGGAVVSGALATSATKLFTLFSDAITFAFTGLGVVVAGLLGAAIIEAVSDKLFGPTSTPFEIMNNAIIQDTQALVQTAKFTITNSEPELVSAVSTILANMGYEIDTFNVTTVAQVNDLFAELMTGFGFNGAEITAMLKTLYSNLGYDLSGFTGTTVAELSAFMSGIMANTNGLGENVDQNASGIQEDVEEAATNSEEAVSTASESIQGNLEDTGSTATEQSTVFTSGMENMSKAVADAASAIASTPIKPIVDTSSIDAGISKLQTFLSLAAQAGSASVSVPSMGSITTSIRHNASSIAALAKGGVIPPNKPFLAMLGDQKKGTNIEAPLDTITQALQQALASYGFSGSNREIVLNIDGTTLARLTVPYNLDELNRKGYNVRVLEGK